MTITASLFLTALRHLLTVKDLVSIGGSPIERFMFSGAYSMLDIVSYRNVVCCAMFIPHVQQLPQIRYVKTSAKRQQRKFRIK